MTENSTRDGRAVRWWATPAGFFAAAALLPVTFLAIVGWGLFAAARAGPVLQTGGSSAAIYFWMQKKERVAREAVGPRVILYGGSSTLYSIRAHEVTNVLHAPVVNMGLHAGLGIDYMLYRARRELQPGDVAVLMFEYGLYSREAPDWTVADYTIPFDLGFLAAQGLSRTVEYAGLITPKEYVRKVYGGWFGAPYPSSQMLGTLNASGDFIANRRVDQGEAQRKSLDDNPVIRPGQLAASQARTIRDFVAWCRARGIFVVAGFPATKDRESYHQPAELAFTSSIASFYRDLGVPLLGEPEEFMFPASMFFDTSYHMHDEGAALMTGLFATRLQEILRCDLFRDWSSVPPAECTRLRRPLVLDFARDDIPAGVASLQGMYARESWGRWTEGTRTRIATVPLAGPFRLRMHLAHVLDGNAPLLATVRIGGERRSFAATRGIIALDFEGSTPGDAIEIDMPAQRTPKEAGINGDTRRLGIGIARIEIVPNPRS